MHSHTAATVPYRALAIAPIQVDNAVPVLYELVGDSIEIGSADDNAIVLADASVAPHHLAVRRVEGNEHLLLDLATRRRCHDLAWTRFKPGDIYWCPRHGRLEQLDQRGRCPQCKRRRDSLWLMRPLKPGDSFDIGTRFRATLVAQSPALPSSEGARLAFPPNERFGTEASCSRRVSIFAGETEIPAGTRPAHDSNWWQWYPAGAPFPIFLHQRVNRLIARHARANRDREVGGVLLGDVHRDAGRRLFVTVSHALQAEFANESRGQLTFTQKTWLKIHQAHESQHPDKAIVGWYHTHPGWTIFLSEWDLFIHRNFFHEPWQIALVLDPSLDQAGFFVWNGNDVGNPQEPVEPFRVLEAEGWADAARPRVRIKFTDTGVPART